MVRYRGTFVVFLERRQVIPFVGVDVADFCVGVDHFAGSKSAIPRIRRREGFRALPGQRIQLLPAVVMLELAVHAVGIGSSLRLHLKRETREKNTKNTKK